MSWFVYMLRCSDDTLYTGVSKDLELRLHAHNHLKTGAKYTRARRPVELVYREEVDTRSGAQKREAEIKGMSREEKLRFLKNYSPSTASVLP